MGIRSLSNEALLALLIGPKTAARIYKGRLATLVFEDNKKTSHKKLQASLEFSRRVFRENLICGPSLNSPLDTREYLMAHFQGILNETFVVIFLDNRHRVIGIEEMFRGTIDGASVYPRVVVSAVIGRNAAACIFAHNHPSGVAEPSQADIQITRRLKEAE